MRDVEGERFSQPAPLGRQYQRAAVHSSWPASQQGGAAVLSVHDCKREMRNDIKEAISKNVNENFP